MIPHSAITDSALRKRIRQKALQYGGNRKLYIHGLLNCASGKRMKREHRVFFSTAQEAVDNGYWPCGHCMRHEYKKWKHGLVQ